MPTTIPSAPTMTPNDAFRHVRKIYVACVGIAIPLLFLGNATTAAVGLGVG